MLWKRQADFPLWWSGPFASASAPVPSNQPLEQLGTFMDRQISMGVKRLTALLEPILLMIIGVVVIFIIVSVLWPVYGILGEIG